MANASTVGALRVVLGLDSAAFEGGMTQAQAHLKRVGQQMQAVGGAMKVAGAAMVAAFVAAATGAATAVTALSKNIIELEAQAKTAGVSFEKFQSLKYAADRNSVSVAALTDGLKEMNLRADEFIRTGKGAGEESFNRLGFGATDLAARLKDPSALFEELIGRMQQLDKAGQIRVADEIFGGTGGAEFVRFLDQGVEGVRQLRAEFAKSGNLITPQQLAQAQKMQESVQNLKDALGNLTRALLDTGLVQWFVDVSAGVARIVAKLNEAVPGFVKWAAIIAVGVGALGALLIVVGTVVSSIGALTVAFTAMSVKMTAAGGAAALLRGALTALAVHPVLIALTAIGVALAFVIAKSREATPEQKALKAATDDLAAATEAYEVAALAAATASGEGKKAAMEEAAALRVVQVEAREAARQKLNTARASLIAAAAARQEFNQRLSNAGEGMGTYARTSGRGARLVGDSQVASLRAQTAETEAAIARADAIIARIDEGLNAPAPASFADLSGSGGKGPKGKTADQLAQEAEARRRAIEDMAATFNLQEAQLLNDQERVKVLEREEAVRQRTRALIDAGIETDRAAAGAEAERMQVRLDAAMEQQQDRELQDSQKALSLDLARTDENYALVRQLERQAELRERVLMYQRQKQPLDSAERLAAMDIAELDRARAAAAQRRLADAREEHRLALAQLSGNERLTRQLQDQAEIRERTRRYQMEGTGSPIDAERQATNEVRLERAATRHGEAREMFSSAFSDGVRAAMAGDLKGFLSNQFGTFMSEAFKRLGKQLYDSIFGTFDAVAEGTTQGTAQGMAAGPQILAAGQGAAMSMGASIRAAGQYVAGLFRASQSPGPLQGGGSSSGLDTIARVSSILQSLPGFANEGTIRASGSSGIDSQLVAFWKSPREQVDIYQPGGRGSGGGGEMIHRVIVTPDRDSFITLAGEAAMPLVESGSHAAFAGSRAQVPADMARSDRYTRGR